MPVKYTGNNVVLLLQNVDNPTEVLPALCNRNLTYERNREWIEKTTLEGYEVGHVKGLKRGQVTFNDISVFLSPGDEGYYDELLRQWFESGDLLICRHKTEVGSDVREIVFFGVIQDYRTNGNQSEVANYDITILQTANELNIPCPTLAFDNDWSDIEFEFTPNAFADSYTFTLLQGETVIETITVTNEGIDITVLFDDLEQNTNYILETTITYLGTLTKVCPAVVVTPKMVDCPLLSLTVGETQVEVCSNADAQLTQIVYRIADDLDPLNILDFEIITAPFTNPECHTFTGLTDDTVYFVQVLLQNIGGPVNYLRSCGWIEFTTGTPYVPPTGTGITGWFGTELGTVCDDPLNTTGLYYMDAGTEAPGVGLYYDEDLANPVTGFSYFVVNLTGAIWLISTEGVFSSLQSETCEIE
jgi:hypothetical protein